MMKIPNICKNCKHYSQDGTCHRYPPTMVYEAKDDHTYSFYPEVEPDEFCGEFSVRPEVLQNDTNVCLDPSV